MSLNDEPKLSELIGIVKTLAKQMANVLDVLGNLTDQNSDNHDELLKKIHESRAFMNILEKNQKTIWKKLLDLAEEEPESTEPEPTT